MTTDGTPGSALTLADRYHELMSFRNEALAKYHANPISVIAGPPVRVNFPTIGTYDRGTKYKRLGPFFINDRPPIFSFVEDVMRSRRAGVRIVEIGPGGGELARHIQMQFKNRVRDYFAIDRDPTVDGPWTRLETIEDAPSDIDIVIASEVMEHMPAETFFSTILEPLAPKLNKDATFIASTPNPLSPGGIARDLTHVQNYPWYDLSAFFRLVFEDVDVFRAYYAYDPKHLLQILPRFVLCFLLEIEWCPSLVSIARMPRRASQ